MATRFSFSRLRAVDANERIMPGAKLAFYQSGTSTPKATYSDAAVSVAHTNPVVADSGGRFPDIYLDTGLYKAVLLDSADVVQWTSDPIGKEVLDETQITIADQSVAEEGVDNAALMTPLRTAQAFDARISDLEWIGNRGRIQGLALANNTTDADADIDIAAGLAATDTSPYRLMALNATLTKQIDAAWAVGSGAGGLDTGSVAADTWYHVWLIQRSDTDVTDALFSLSPTSPTMPTNYDRKRRIGAVLTDGTSDILAFTQRGDWVQWSVVPMIEQAITSAAGQTIQLRTPPFVADARLRFFCATNDGVLLRSPDESDAAPSRTVAPLASNHSNAEANSLTIITDNQGRIGARAIATTCTIRVVTIGWWDTRGRHD